MQEDASPFKSRAGQNKEEEWTKKTDNNKSNYKYSEFVVFLKAAVAI